MSTSEEAAFAADPKSYLESDGYLNVRQLPSGVLAMRERGGKMKAMQIEDADAATLHTAIHHHVEAGSAIHTDEASAYKGIGGLFFDHETVNHGNGEYVRDHVTTNGVESVFAVMKRGIDGVYHHASKKHLHRYVDEFAFRLNDGNVSRHTLERLDSFVGGVAAKRLTYKNLIN